MLLAMLGNVIGPPVSGILSQYVGWRATFYTLAVGVLFTSILVFFFIPETRPRKYTPFKFNPLVPLLLTWKWPLVSLTLPNAFVFAAMYVMLAQSSQLLTTYFGLSSLLVGIILIPSGFGSLLGSLLSGKIATSLRSRFGIQGNLSFFIVASLGSIISGIIYGWLIPYSIVVSVVCLFVSGFAGLTCRTIIFSHSTEVNQASTGATVAGLICFQFVLISIVMTISGLLLEYILPGWIYTSISLITFCTLLLSFYTVWKKNVGLNQNMYNN